ncbi:MAG: penicillin acylase family protein [Bacteroidetes bacterium]|nr:penicillin acylase family protein [Bacteroidota bacterium]
MKILPLLYRLGAVVLLYFGLNYPIGGTLRLGNVLDPYAGVWGTARAAKPLSSGSLMLEGMSEPVQLEVDERGVPHIFASSDRDATIALGYVVARDRLFQMDFIHRAATGTLSELLGASAISTDRFFRQNGIADAVFQNASLLSENLPREAEAAEWYGLGVNAYLENMSRAEVPFEYKIMDASPPESFSSSYTMALFAFMTYDLSFQNSDVRVTELKKALGEIDFAKLYPVYGSYEKTIILPEEAHWNGVPSSSGAIGQTSSNPLGPSPGANLAVSEQFNPTPELAEGFFDGKGSNNWAVDGSRSTTGKPILAGDMHLGLSLPAIWYEAHLVTPTANVYGVTFPSVPGIVEGITPTTAWAFTNTGSDQIDTYSLQINESRDAYLFDDEWRPLTVIVDSIRVKNGDTVVETRLKSHLGPVISSENESSDSAEALDYAIKWVGHEFGKTFSAIWDMNRATNYAEFESAIRAWDYPMQNILYAGADGIIAIRSTGYMPIRAQGNAFGVQDGTTSKTAWIGRVPFDELPHAISPNKGFVTSTNQRPAPDGYPFYLDQDFRSIYRSMRIYELLEGTELHTPEDIRKYQSDVKAVQADLFLPLIREVEGLSEAGNRLRGVLLSFDGEMALSSKEAGLFAAFMKTLIELTWDEQVFSGSNKPKEIRILDLFATKDEKWFDRVTTPEVETLNDLLRQTLDEEGEKWKNDSFTQREWQEERSLVVRHITRSEALKSLWRGPFPFPGYSETLSPAPSNPTYWSASWRVVVDFSTSPPQAWGVYPGGQSGNPFSMLYDDHLQKYVNFDYYRLKLPASPSEMNQ